MLRSSVTDLLLGCSLCQAAVVEQKQALMVERCVPIAMQAVVLLSLLWVLLRLHRRWARWVLVIMAMLVYYQVPHRLSMQLRPYPVISRVDPSYALLGEEIRVSPQPKTDEL